MAIILEKKGQHHSINLSKDVGNGEMKINLNWSNKKGLLGAVLGAPDVDLDLGCYYLLKDGDIYLIDGLQFSKNRGGPRDKCTKQGCYTNSPYIWHTGDDRSGSSDTGETILVNPAGFKVISQILVYTFIYEGAPKWENTDAVVTIKVPGNEDIIVKMDEYDSTKSFCAIARINFLENNTMSVEKLMTFHSGHSDCDITYHWGFAWRKSKK